MTYRAGGHLQSVLNYEYSTGNLIGHGAFALVFKGRRKRTHEAVAIKQISLKSVPGRLSNIRQKEIAILKDVKHCNVVQLYDYHEEQSHIYLVMEYCNGGDLGDYLQAKQTLSEDSIRHLANHVSGALNALQTLHIIHRDIKPQNLLLSYPPVANGNGTNGGGGSRRDRPIREATVKLADFGFARYLTGTDMAATLCGSPLYMAPEILLGEKYDSKADLWSVGTILYQCLTGTAPFLATNPHALRKRYEKEKLVPKIPDGTSRYLASLLLQLLRKNPRERLNHEDLCVHPFLRDPSILASGYLVMTSQPQPRAKSSPVPIQRHAPSPSPYTSSSRQSTSPRYSPFEISDTYTSPSSGPPSIHPVGSASSLPRQPSPSTDITDHGFVLVDTPVGLSSRRSSSSPLSIASSPHSGSFCSACSHTPSSSGHTPSSSYGSSSLQRYRSLITPFYQVQPVTKNSNGSTPPAVPEKGSEGTGNGLPSQPSEPRPLSRSNSSKRRSSDPSHLSHTPPFGKLMQLVPMATQSPLSSPYSTLHRHATTSPSSSPSPFPTPPSMQQSPSTTGPASSPVTGRHGLRYSLSAHSSGTKLSSLAEQAEMEVHPQGGKEPERGIHRVDSGLRFEDLITPSQLLGSDEEEENFPLSLSLTSSQSSNKTDEQDLEQATVGGIAEDSGTRFLVFEQDRVKFTARRASQDSGVGGRGGGEGREGSGKVRRATSFSSKRSNPQLVQELQQIRSRAASLSAHQSQLLDSDFTPTPTTLKQYDFQLSPGARIKHVPLPFVFPPSSSSTASSTSSQPPSSTGRDRTGRELSDHTHQEAGGGPPPCLAPLTHSMMLARELLGMAKAREGPIMLLSTDLSASGGASRSQRYSEQLVLYAKAITVLESGLRQYEIEMAAHSMEPSQILRTAEAEARELQESCLERARLVREEMERVRVGGGRRGSLPHSSHPHNSHPHTSLISAEKLLLIEALDMCKNAVLSEQSGEDKECVKRYRRAKMIFTQLLSDAKSHRDRAVLQSYLHSVHTRIHRLTSL